MFWRAIMVYADDGIRSCIYNHDPAAVAWARDRFEGVAAEAMPTGESSTRPDRA